MSNIAGYVSSYWIWPAGAMLCESHLHLFKVQPKVYLCLASKEWYFIKVNITNMNFKEVYIDVLVYVCVYINM